MTATPAPVSIGDNYKLYSLCWHQLESAGAKESWSLFEKMKAIEDWSKTGVPVSRREQEQLAAIDFAATGALAAGVFLQAA
jgi:hypothetical protein